MKTTTCRTLCWSFILKLAFLNSVQVTGGNYNGDDIVGTSPLLLLGTPNVETSKVQLPFKVWANPKRSAQKPKKRDLHEQKLLQLLGSDYDQRWMRKSKDKHGGIMEETDRKAVRTLRGLVDSGNYDNNRNASSSSKDENQLQLPEDLPAQYKDLVKNWLVRRATCPIRFDWIDLGPYFWPRWIKRGKCIGNVACSWPPGMNCVPSAAKILNILRWHCRLRKSMRRGKKRKNETNLNNTVEHVPSSANSTVNGVNNNNTNPQKKRKKYRCMWIKVPYPVPEDCVCSCKSTT